MKRIGKLIGIILKTVGYIALTVLLLAAFSDRISPLVFVWASYLGLFFPFILGLNVLVFVFYLLFRQWKHVGIYLIAFLICSGSIRTYFPFHTKTKNVPENCIKLLSYNVMRFGSYHSHTKENPNPIIQFIADCDADIICLQEYGFSNDVIIKALKKTPYHFIEGFDSPYTGLSDGIAVFSKYPILKAEKIPYESKYNASFLFELDVNGKKVTLINNHLESNQLTEEERAGYYDLTKDPNAEKLEFFTQMMHKRLTPAFKARAKQAQQIAKIIKEDKNPYIIVCGDFNDTPISYTRHKIKGNLKDAFVSTGKGMGISYNKHRFLFRIDHILHSKNIKAYNCTVGNLKTSDHYPIWTYLEFKD